MNWIAWTILFFLVADFLLHLAADRLNLDALTDDIPKPFKNIFDSEKYRKAQAYLRTNTRFGQIVGTVDLLMLLGFWFGGGFALVDGWARLFGWGSLATGLLFIGVLAGLVFFGLLYAPVDFFLGMIGHCVSRRHEYAADQFAATTTGKIRPMVDALRKLSVHNLSNLSPHPLYVFLNYSHPPVLQRITALEDGGRRVED